MMLIRESIYRYRLHHLPAWALLFAGWHFFRYQDYPPGIGWLITLIKVADLALMIYLTNYLLIPRLLYRKHYVSFAAVYFLMIMASSIGKMYLLGWLLNNRNLFDLFENFKGRFYDNVLPHILLVSTGAAFKLLTDQVKAQRKLALLAREKSEAELNFLKGQINPHFLFNSLNSIYFLIDRKNEEARETLLRFSDLLRYQLYECGADVIPIEKEIAFLKDYIRLQALRRDAHYRVNMEVAEGLGGFGITPLLLIPFVENAFKHISHHAVNENYVVVLASRENGHFHFSVANSKDDRQTITEPTGGIGLTNVRRRLELIYPGKHQLLVNDDKEHFRIDLRISV